MKKLFGWMVFGYVMLSSQAWAEKSELYVGLDLFHSDVSRDVASTIGNESTDNKSNGFVLKFGSTLEDDWRLQGYFSSEDFDKNTFSHNEGSLNEIGIDVIKAFEMIPELYPFIQAGLGYGVIDAQGYEDDSIAEVSLKGGFGLLYRIDPTFEGVVGLDFKYRKWQDIDVFNTATVETDDTSINPYVGINIHF